MLKRDKRLKVKASFEANFQVLETNKFFLIAAKIEANSIPIGKIFNKE
ncbi:hypothetical protein THIOSC15_1200005 [uncultured Thiomicrorhabdus sp.]